MVEINPYVPGESTSPLHAIWDEALASLHPPYALPAAKLHDLLNFPTAKVFVASSSDGVVGWALTYMIRTGSAADAALQHLRGGLAALVVHPSHQRAGVGSALHAAALEYLEPTIRASFALSLPPPTEGLIQLGSAFPRIFPGPPDLPPFEPAIRFFVARGWAFKDARTTDFYGALPTGVDQEALIAPATAHGVSFRPATAGDREEVMALEYREFGTYCGWPDMFPLFFDEGHAADIHLALRDGVIIGATFAALPGSPLDRQLAFPATLGKACGAIGCVGVSAAARGTGAGVGMVASAMLDLERRGADGVFIDWVNMLGFYERFGVRRWEGAYTDASRVVAAQVPICPQ